MGTYFESETRTCEPCPVGTYQSETGQQQCAICPAIAGRQGVTVGPGARSASDCKGKTVINEIQFSFLFPQLLLLKNDKLFLYRLIT